MYKILLEPKDLKKEIEKADKEITQYTNSQVNLSNIVFKNITKEKYWFNSNIIFYFITGTGYNSTGSEIIDLIGKMFYSKGNKEAVLLYNKYYIYNYTDIRSQKIEKEEFNIENEYNYGNFNICFFYEVKKNSLSSKPNLIFDDFLTEGFNGVKLTNINKIKEALITYYDNYSLLDESKLVSTNYECYSNPNVDNSSIKGANLTYRNTNIPGISSLYDNNFNIVQTLVVQEDIPNYKDPFNKMNDNLVFSKLSQDQKMRLNSKNLPNDTLYNRSRRLEQNTSSRFLPYDPPLATSLQFYSPQLLEPKNGFFLGNVEKDENPWFSINNNIGEEYQLDMVYNKYVEEMKK